ncbi:MAG: polyamine aminopropyltransferase [Pirellulales bacterium]|nr:polyamine aminopropyltransferase [Pirellulales bacterium]
MANEHSSGEQQHAAGGNEQSQTTVHAARTPMSMNRAPLFLLYLNVLIVATCGLIYELLAGTLASYVLGDSVTQFSLVIGIYLSALGAGAWLSRFIERRLARTFLEVELGVALLGGCSAPLLFLCFAYLSWFHVALYGLVFAIGVLVGLELPLLMRILKEHVDFRDLVSRALAFDYIGALAASLLFPILLVPYLGLVRTSLLFGAMNAAVALWGTWLLAPILSRKGVAGLRGRAVLVIGLLAAGFIKSESLTTLAEEHLFEHPIVHAVTSPYQRIVVTQSDSGFRLFLDGNLQFHSGDEYRYHEALVHPAMLLVDEPRRVLVLGGGDGLAVREILKHDSVEEVVLVDLDPAMTHLSSTFSLLVELNQSALHDPRVRVVNQDAMSWLEESEHAFDTVIIDFPDPNSFALGKLYTRHFYRLLKTRLHPESSVAVQCTSPMIAPQSYWCILETLEAAGLQVQPYHTAMPSFGVWGFALAKTTAFEVPKRIPAPLQERLTYLNETGMAALFQMPEDLKPVDVEINRLNNQMLVKYYETEWSKWN